MEKPQEKSVVRPGVWSMKVRDEQKTVLLVENRNRFGGDDDRPREVISWENILRAGKGSATIIPYMVWKEDIEWGKDITEEFFADSGKLMLLAERQPKMFDVIFTERSELTVPADVIREWNGSSDRESRILAIKYLARVDRDKVAGSKSVESEKGASRGQ